MADIILFPFARSAGIVRAFADRQARHEEPEAINAAWRTPATELAHKLIGAVPADEINSELFRLLDRSVAMASRKRAARQRAAARREPRLRIVPPAQRDLFEAAPVTSNFDRSDPNAAEG